MSDASVVQARLVGALFVERGLLTDEQLERALERQAQSGELLGEILVTEFEISRIELASVLAEQWAELEHQEEQKAEAGPGPTQGNGTAGARRRIGEIFVERGFVSESELEQALETQKESGQPLGEVLIERAACRGSTSRARSPSSGRVSRNYGRRLRSESRAGSRLRLPRPPQRPRRERCGRRGRRSSRWR